MIFIRKLEASKQYLIWINASVEVHILPKKLSDHETKVKPVLTLKNRQPFVNKKKNANFAGYYFHTRFFIKCIYYCNLFRSSTCFVHHQCLWFWNIKKDFLLAFFLTNSLWQKSYKTWTTASINIKQTLIQIIKPPRTRNYSTNKTISFSGFFGTFLQLFLTYHGNTKFNRICWFLAWLKALQFFWYPNVEWLVRLLLY